jgi:hypothetical protein
MDPDEGYGGSLKSLVRKEAVNKATEHTASIPVRSKYPVAAAIMQPTRRPNMTLADFMIGDPNLSMIRMVTKTEKPRPGQRVNIFALRRENSNLPIYSALPQGKACFAAIFGHFAKKSVGVAAEQGPEPPAQLLKPV